MMNLNLENLATIELMRGYAAILDELRKRGVVRTNNAPIGDYTEHLVAKTLGLTLENNSRAGYDAVDLSGIRYQIKSRKISKSHPTMQLGAIRNLEAHSFDFLIAVLFQADFSIMDVVKIPYEIVGIYGVYREYTNSHSLHLREEIMKHNHVENITHMFR